MNKCEFVEIEGVTHVRAASEGIVCIIHGETVYIPISQIHPDSEVWRLGQEGTLVIPRWLALEKGLL